MELKGFRVVAEEIGDLQVRLSGSEWRCDLPNLDTASVRVELKGFRVVTEELEIGDLQVKLGHFQKKKFLRMNRDKNSQEQSILTRRMISVECIEI